MFVILLLAYFAYRNSVRAKLKGENSFLWGAVTVAASFAALLIGGFVVIFNFCGDVNVDALSSPDINLRQAASEQLKAVFLSNPLNEITVQLFAVGGYLLVRYILDKKPGKKQAEIHWMDKLGDQ